MFNELLKPKYDFLEVEQNRYQSWNKSGYFNSGDITRKPYTVVIPPPNVTGKLHLGHAWDTALQDIIIRKKRMEGYDALWLPGMDHAGIATQAKIEEKLRKDGISRYDLGRERFLDVAWSWKEEYAQAIRSQWATLGLSLDYNKERFTLDEGLNEAVNHVFIKLYEEGLIYRGYRIINWDCQSKTALSNVEVEYKDIEGAFYHFNYLLEDGSGHLTIATTRPETMFGDVALMVHPDDTRFQAYVGKKVYIPTTNRLIPVITDHYVDMEFGTGVVKVTPAHDPNDFEVGIRHGLDQPLCMEEDGKMNDLAGNYSGLDRFACRKQLVEDLLKANQCPKIEKMIHAVGHSERTGVIVEPRLSNQWFVKMDVLARDVANMQASSDTKIHFVPERFEKTFQNWVDNTQDWCISRQLWWGHRIPAYYKDDNIYVGLTPPDATWVQDDDVLDTWFSSALWPFSTLGWPHETPDLSRYFPTDTLVTGYDIIFFWVARMAFQSKHFMNSRPFKHVLIHGLIRDEQGRKMSKSLGNGVDPMDLVEQYGADSLRYFLTTNASPGQDLRFSDEKIASSWNYINKIWNISRFIQMNLDAFNYQNEAINESMLSTIDRWILSQMNELIDTVDDLYERFEFGELAKLIYNFVWDDFASWYIELTKVVFSTGSHDQKINTCAVLKHVLTTILKLLHPIIPFVTDAVYEVFYQTSIMTSAWPTPFANVNGYDTELMRALFDTITSVRNIRSLKNVVPSKPVELILSVSDRALKEALMSHSNYLTRFTNADPLRITNQSDTAEDMVVEVLTNVTVMIPLSGLIDVEKEIEKLENDLVKLEEEIKRSKQMLENPRFVEKAPAQKVTLEQDKLDNYIQQLEETKKRMLEIKALRK
ncbi:MAG TPA: valine--tRNA ligase [Bacilli bacterium]|nr:valine--tRNA ligase [Bacilli bacterium]